MSTGITAGARGAAAGLGQASAGNARTPPRPRKPGLKSKSRGLETSARAAVERREASAPEARAGGDICSCGAANLICAFRRSASLYLFGGETSVAFVLAAKLGREGRRENAIARTFRPPLSRSRMIGYALDWATGPVTGDRLARQRKPDHRASDLRQPSRMRDDRRALRRRRDS